MSSHIWTPHALASELRPASATLWRLVEAQHVVSTLKLVDSLEEQAVLEAVLEATKPPVPPECRHLHYLLYTPFRYRPYPHPSRFRRAGPSPGVFYAAEAVETALAESAFYRLLFFAASPATPWPSGAADFTAFAVKAKTPFLLDLIAPPLERDRAAWMHPSDYAATLALSDAAREAGAEAIRYASVRDPAGGANWAVLTCRAFAAPEPLDTETWRLRVGAFGVQAVSDHPRRRIGFGREAFAGDPRLAGMAWDRPS